MWLKGWRFGPRDISQSSNLHGGWEVGDWVQSRGQWFFFSIYLFIYLIIQCIYHICSCLRKPHGILRHLPIWKVLESCRLKEQSLLVPFLLYSAFHWIIVSKIRCRCREHVLLLASSGRLNAERLQKLSCAHRTWFLGNSVIWKHCLCSWGQKLQVLL